MTRLALSLCLALAGVACAPQGQRPACREAIIAPAQEPKPPPDKRVGPFFPRRTLRAAFV